MFKTEFFKPATVKEAVELLDKYKEDVAIVNGGTDIVIDISAGRKHPANVVFVADIPELKNIEVKDGKVVIGGAVTYNEMLASPVIQAVDGLYEAVSNVGSPAVRQVGTPAGNIANAAPAADAATMLVGLDAEVVLASVGGERVVPLSKWYKGRGVTEKAPNELIKAIAFKQPVKGVGTGYVRLARRKAQDIAKVLIGVTLSVEGGVCKSAVVSFGALNAVIVRATSVEEALVGKTKDAALKYVKETWPKEAALRPSRFTHYKELVTNPALERAVAQAWNNAEVK